jgi:hypothetical protein
MRDGSCTQLHRRCAVSGQSSLLANTWPGRQAKTFYLPGPNTPVWEEMRFVISTQNSPCLDDVRVLFGNRTRWPLYLAIARVQFCTAFVPLGHYSPTRYGTYLG